MQTIILPNLGGGANSYSSADMIGNAEMQTSSRNVRGDAESCKPRKGYTTFADTQTGSVVGVPALGAYTRNAEANDVLIMIYNTKIWKINPATGSTWTEITTSLLTSQATVSMASYADNLYIFNGVDKPLQVANTTVTQPFTAPASVSTANFVPAFGEVYLNSLFVAGVPTAPNTVFVSKVASSAVPNNIYDFSGALTSFGDAQEILAPGRVTAMKKFNSAMVIFTVDSAAYVPGLKDLGTAVTYDAQPISGSGGAVSQKSTCVVENDVFYLTPQKEIKSVKRSQANQDSFTTTALSKKIQKFLNENMDDDTSTAFAYYDQTNKLYKLVFKPKDGRMNYMRIVADLNKVDQFGVPAWYIDDNMPFSSGIFYKGQAYVGSTILGQVYKDEDSLADDDDASIVSIRVGKEVATNNTSVLKTFRRVQIPGRITQSTVATAKVYVDGIFVCSSVIDSTDLSSGATANGIGTSPIADMMIADETDGDADPTNLFNVNKDITFRRRGRSIRVDIETDGVNNDYRFDSFIIGILPVPSLLSPILEK